MYAASPEDCVSSWKAVGPEDTISLIYTSGTTGPPKGVVYSHYNIAWTLESIGRFWSLFDQTLVSYLPLAHVSERFTSQWGGIYFGQEVWFCPDINQLLPYLVAARPTEFVGVPRVWEKLMAGLRAGGAAERDEAKRQMAQGAMSAAISAYRLRHEGKPVPDELASVVERAQPLFTMLRAKIGLDRCTLAVTSTAPCRPEVHEFWAAMGMPLYEAWGMSDLTGPASAVPHDDHQAPSISRATAGVEIRLGEDGELLVRGGNVMMGYYREPAKTAEMVDADGWVHSGDIAEAGLNGQYKIIDRKKELIISSAGENNSPPQPQDPGQANPILRPAWGSRGGEQGVPPRGGA